jgi:hypothetical protein
MSYFYISAGIGFKIFCVYSFLLEILLCEELYFDYGEDNS